MKLKTEPYLDQKDRWPPSGKVILAQYDLDSIVVYQAYRPSIGHFAAQNGYFGEDFKLSRMTWIKPNFLWMMYRSGWGIKEGQEVTLASLKEFAGTLNQLSTLENIELIEKGNANEMLKKLVTDLKLKTKIKNGFIVKGVFIT